MPTCCSYTDPAAEESLVADGFALQRHPVMYNDFVLIGPAASSRPFRPDRSDLGLNPEACRSKLVNPAKHPQTQALEAQKFVDWVTSPAGQGAIVRYRINGQPLFFPSAARWGRRGRWPPPYNGAVPVRPFAHPRLSLWTRLAVLLGFLAVLSALWAPAALLAQEVRSGQLSGICHFKAAPGDGLDSGAGGASQDASHCDLCGSPGWSLPPPALAATRCPAGPQVAVADTVAQVAAAGPVGLPFSRGPPAPLS